MRIQVDLERVAKPESLGKLQPAPSGELLQGTAEFDKERNTARDRSLTIVLIP
jgi:hypothetical protein